MTSSKDPFAELVNDVQQCRKCPRMEKSERVFGHACGSRTARVMFIGEAPGRLGADASLMPFHGDRSGHNFEALLEHVGMTRYDTFITNAVLCNPKDEDGNNSSPTKHEILNCAPFLARQIELVGPRVVATLGAVALKSCALVNAHNHQLSSSVRTALPWNGRILVPLYHPGQRAMMHRSFANQLADYQFLKEVATRDGRQRSRSKRPPSQEVAEIVEYMIGKQERLSYFAMHKLLFLAEVKHLEDQGERMTGSYVVRQKDGPYFVELHPSKLAHAGFVLSGGNRPLVGRQSDLVPGKQTSLPLSWIRILDYVLDRYGALTDFDLKNRVYLTRPMRAILRAEKAGRVNMFNAPLLAET